MITATDTTNGTYCLHDSVVSEDRSMDEEEDNSGTSRFSFVSREDDDDWRRIFVAAPLFCVLHLTVWKGACKG